MPERRERAPEPVDNDERAANLLARGYAPAMASQLPQRLADVQAELETEREKLAAGRRRQERIHRDHQAGKITAFDIARMQDFDEGGQATVERLGRRAESLRHQLADMSALISPQPQGVADPVESASRAARGLLADEARASRPSRPAREPRPFAPGGGAAVRSDVTCGECIAAGASPEESFLIHADPEPVPAPAADAYCRGCGALADSCRCTGPATRTQVTAHEVIRYGGEIAGAQ